MGGDKQVQGVNFFKSYAPVVQWTTIHLILILVIILDWVTVQIDHTNAYAEAMLDEKNIHGDSKTFITQVVDKNYVL